VDLYYIVESWLTDNDSAVIGELEDGGNARVSGGGLCCLYNSSLKVNKNSLDAKKTMEIMETSVNISSKKFTVVTIYRPGATDKNRYTMDEFFDELCEVLSYYSTLKNEAIFIGYFNIHVNKPTDHNAKKLQALLELFDLHQHITTPTHQNGNTLDLVITRKESIVSKCIVSDLNSDHANILVHLNIGKSRPSRKTVAYRNYKNIDMMAFKSDIRDLLSQANPHCLDDLISKFLATSDILDRHAPITLRRESARKPTPWSKADIVDQKTLKRRLEKRWKRSKNLVDLEAFKKQRNKYNTMLNNIRQKFISDLVSKNRNNSRNMFKAINYALHRKVTPPLPPHESATDLANEFCDFFDDKISKIRSKLDKDDSPPPVESNEFTGTPLSEFRSMTQPEIRTILNNLSKFNLTSVLNLI
jgi:hypothetical protein